MSAAKTKLNILSRFNNKRDERNKQEQNNENRITAKIHGNIGSLNHLI
jgi:hypothetical protein